MVKNQSRQHFSGKDYSILLTLEEGEVGSFIPEVYIKVTELQIKAEGD